MWLNPSTTDRFAEILKNRHYRTLCDLHSIFQEATFDHWREEGGRPVMLPVTTTSVSSPMGLGSDSKPVEVLMAGVPVYLADSMQFLLEYTTRLTGRPTLLITAEK